MAARTSGRRRIEAVGVVCVRSAGARISAFGEGSDVRCGFWERAADRAESEVGGVMR